MVEIHGSKSWYLKVDRKSPTRKTKFAIMAMQSRLGLPNYEPNELMNNYVLIVFYHINLKLFIPVLIFTSFSEHYSQNSCFS